MQDRGIFAGHLPEPAGCETPGEMPELSDAAIAAKTPWLVAALHIGICTTQHFTCKALFLHWSKLTQLCGEAGKEQDCLLIRMQTMLTASACTCTARPCRQNMLQRSNSSNACDKALVC